MYRGNGTSKCVKCGSKWMIPHLLSDSGKCIYCCTVEAEQREILRHTPDIAPDLMPLGVMI